MSDEIGKVLTDPTRLFDLRAVRERLEEELEDAADEVVRLSGEAAVAANDAVRRSNEALAELLEEHSRVTVDELQPSCGRSLRPRARTSDQD
jgi:hypothetical protein